MNNKKKITIPGAIDGLRIAMTAHTSRPVDNGGARPQTMSVKKKGKKNIKNQLTRL